MVRFCFSCARTISFHHCRWFSFYFSITYDHFSFVKNHIRCKMLLRRSIDAFGKVFHLMCVCVCVFFCAIACKWERDFYRSSHLSGIKSNWFCSFFLLSLLWLHLTLWLIVSVKCRQIQNKRGAREWRKMNDEKIKWKTRLSFFIFSLLILHNFRGVHLACEIWDILNYIRFSSAV